ncbi:Aspartic protease pep1 [Lecanosticta acicola]|uniref:Aspartic protease pep1 n=1 Tax=Lecanosticta acicola TaxID=111012 RepID=A0AAI8YWE9_9PEZI|nr:Aspartic protease pep1 [Lecanosticta acicola]
MDSGGNNNGFANNSMFADSQQFNAYDNLSLFQNGVDSTFTDASWGVNASDYPNQNQSRGQQSAPSWQQNANHLSAQSANPGYSGQASPYGRPITQSPAPYAQNAFNNLGAQQNFQYRQQQYDPSLGKRPSNNGQNFNLPMHGYNSPVPNSGTITPQALNRPAPPSPFPGNPYGGSAYQPNYGYLPPNRPQSTNPQARPVDGRALAASIPQGSDSGMFSVIDLNGLSQATSSERMGNFVNVGKEALEFDCSRSAVPAYVPRKSRNELRTLAGNNPNALAKIGKKPKVYSSYNRPLLTSDVAGAQRVLDEQSSPSSDETSSDDDVSEYSDDDEASDSPLPAKRPDNPKGGIEHDTIKALWRSKRKSLDGDTVRRCLVDFWELIKTVRDRWKSDSAAYAEAEEKKRTGELPLLQSRVKDGRDMIEVAFRTALKHGHRGIVELLAENVALVFLCYQFLLDRLKAEDCNGSLSRAILETMSTFTTLTKSKLEKIHLDKILPRVQKKGDAKTQHWVKKILSNAETASKEAADKAAQKEPGKSSSTTRDGPSSSSAKKGGSETVAGVKRPATATLGDGTASKKAAIGMTKPTASTSASKISGVVKKPPAPEGNKPTSTAGSTAIKKTVTAASKSSGFFSSLQSAAKKPGTSIADKAMPSGVKTSATRSAGATGSSAPKPAFSFAETMANLAKPKEEKPKPKLEKEVPQETPEERAKRLRKEQRRKLHVQFKRDDELVSIKYFTHDPEEDIGHDSSQMRDVADVGGEGRMLKQQHHMDIDDEDDMAEESEELRKHKPPTLVDFSGVDKEERKRNYAPYGGGELEPVSAERAKRDQYESNNLIVFYTDPSQIPPNPKEPAEPYNGDQVDTIKYLGAPEERYAARARARIAPTNGLFSDYGQGTVAQPTAAPGSDITSILATLQQNSQAQTTYQQQPQAAPVMGQPYMGGQPQQTAQGLGGLDLAAILASLQPNNQQQASYGAAGAPSMNFFPPQPQMFGAASAGTGQDQEDEASKKAKNPNYKTKTCRFWEQGKCQKGDACSYLHETK